MGESRQWPVGCAHRPMKRSVPEDEEEEFAATFPTSGHEDDVEAWRAFLRRWRAKELEEEEKTRLRPSGTETDAEMLFLAFAANKLPKNDFGSFKHCVVKPAGLCSIWDDDAVGTEQLQRGDVLDCDGMLDQLFNCGLDAEKRDQYLLELVRINFGS